MIRVSLVTYLPIKAPAHLPFPYPTYTMLSTRSFVILLLSTLASICSAQTAPAAQPDLLNGSLDALKFPDLSVPQENPNVNAPFQAPSANEAPFNPSIMDELAAWTNTVRRPLQQIKQNDYFLIKNAPTWSKLIPAARDHVAKPEGKRIYWDVLKGQLEAAISAAQSGTNYALIKARVAAIDPAWRKFVAKREELLKKEPSGWISKKVTYTPSELAALDSLYGQYRIAYNTAKGAIETYSAFTTMLPKYRFIKAWLDGM